MRAKTTSVFVLNFPLVLSSVLGLQQVINKYLYRVNWSSEVPKQPKIERWRFWEEERQRNESSVFGSCFPLKEFSDSKMTRVRSSGEPPKPDQNLVSLVVLGERVGDSNLVSTKALS